MTNSGSMEAHSFGNWLRRKRKSLDLTRAGLAERVSCSVGTIQKLEEEERRPSAQIVERLADIFDVPQDERASFLRFARGESRFAPAEAGDPPWEISTKQPGSNLPVTVTSLVGREREIAEVRQYLLRDEIRLVTLTGPPGIGKTRLSLEVARGCLPDFPDGVFFAGLASVDNPLLISESVAQAMGYVGARDISTLEQLKEGIGNKTLLIVFDNCEHLIEDAASFASSLLFTCPRLKILATSRESLRVPGEWLYPVPPLQVPGEDLPVDTNDLATFPALTLFAERAQAVQPNFELNAENIKTVSAICKHLDGLPLAIELLAARTRLMPPPVLVDRLDAQFILGAQGMRAIPARQKSLNQAIDWSYQLLSAEEQQFFAQLSVFSGGFTLEATEKIFSPAYPGNPIADLVMSLLDKSLLQRSLQPGIEPLYGMLGTIQEFAAQRLQEIDPEGETRNKHLKYFLELAGQADAELRGPNQSVWLNRLHTLRSNLRSAFDWALETGQVEKALQLTRRLWWFWSKRSEFKEGRQWCDRVSGMPNVSLFPDLYADVLTQLAHHTCLQIGGVAAKPFIEQALTLARRSENPPTLAHALMVSGISLTHEAEYAAARSALEESTFLFQEIEDPWGTAVATMTLGFSAYKSDRLAAAFELDERALTSFRELGDPYFQSVCLYETGNLRAKQGDWEEGLANVRESLKLSGELGSRYEIAAGLFRLAEIQQNLDQPARAVSLYYAARNVYASIGAWQHEDDLILETHLVPTRTALTEDEFTTAMTEGQGMGIEQAIAYALGSTSDRQT